MEVRFDKILFLGLVLVSVVILRVTVVQCQTTFEWSPRDNNKPHFRDCKDYKPSVKEEQRQNTFVIQVKAYDPDERDTITYKFVNLQTERPKFWIDPKTGVITTMHSFDRDEPIHEKEIYITVQATDNGRPILDDVCTFKVTIEDINDNPPVFDKGKYDESMSEDTQVNSTVMRISASDLDDGNNSVVLYEILPERDYDYFRIDQQHGLIYLRRPIDKQPGQQYVINVHAFNVIQDYPQDAQIEVRIRIIESTKKPPEFINPPDDVIYLEEEKEAKFTEPIVTLEARSNVPDKPEVIFELVTGRTEQTNSKKSFVFNQIGNRAVITLGQRLDYERVTDYTLTMTVRNTYELVAEHVIKIKVLDLNDNIPYFTGFETGTILENEPIGTPVMQVRAFDMDGTEANNIVHFELADNTEFFKIDYYTGNITSLKMFDREERDFYNVKVIASDNSPSSVLKTGEPNRGHQVFRIQIADKNDHKPHFQQGEYIADKLPENANINSVVIEVTAVDEDIEAQIAYSIVSGNEGDAFKIEKLTGKITVNNPLDYETITEYTLGIKAEDGYYEDQATVTIRIEDVNDNPPVFKKNYSTVIQEETLFDDCILTIEAYDPDIKDRDADQEIAYSVVKTEMQNYLEIDNLGCLRLKKPLDRDEPFGYKNWQILIAANDENGSGLKSVTDVTITLNDINDNAPFLTTKPVVWEENRDPGEIVQLHAHDYDEAQNGPPFTFAISSDASDDIRSKFAIDSNGRLRATVTFDREEQKEYWIPINITDNGFPEMSNVSLLQLIIGDVNDNPMKEGSSKIFVYNYKGEAPDTEIGRVYVDDKDDWDWGDKDFVWDSGTISEYFNLNSSTGYITMLEGTPAGDYVLKFVVTEQSNLIPLHNVPADVTVTVKEIPEEAVDKSGSIRFINITSEDFIRLPRDAEPGMLNMKDRFQRVLARLFNTSVENVDVFTLLNNNSPTGTLDVRFSAHGSPYYEAVRLNGLVAQNQREIERQLGVQMLMVNIDECLIEKFKCESYCTNILHKSNVPLLVYTNTTSFVGVNAYTQAECICLPRKETYCLNGGTVNIDETCDCIDGFTGPHCELVAIGFYGQGYAMYPPVSACNTTYIKMELTPHAEDGLVMYLGPMNYNEHLPLSDFLSLELVNGFPVLTVDYGSGTFREEHKHINLMNGKTYDIDIILDKSGFEMKVDNCGLSTCVTLGFKKGPNEFLNVNSPLQLGGTPVDLKSLGLQLNWTHIPQSLGYSGCIQNLTINNFTYNLGRPDLSLGADPGCQSAVAVAVSFNIGKNFLIPILICLICLIILILAFVVHKRQQSGWLEKDTDDIRENIINYEDEGGGERDTDYDLNVLRAPPLYEDKPYKTNLLMKEPNEVPDIGGFLGDKKDSCDKDHGAYPVDDVRHYAYEGDGNSTGSLSSLASCTDDGDLDFDYLSNFGPRFRKLADMYGEEPSDTDSNVDDDQGWRI